MLRPPPISKPDTEFEAKLGVQFVEGREGIVVTELNELFEKVGRGVCVGGLRGAGAGAGGGGAAEASGLKMGWDWGGGELKRQLVSEKTVGGCIEHGGSPKAAGRTGRAAA